MAKKAVDLSEIGMAKGTGTRLGAWTGTAAASRPKLDALDRGYPIKTPSGVSKIARPSVAEDERYRLTMGQQPRGLTAYEANAKLSRAARNK